MAVTDRHDGAPELERVILERDAWARAHERFLLGAVRGFRRRAELERGEEPTRRSLSAAGMGLWDYRVGDREIHVAPGLPAALGYLPDEAPATISVWLRALLPADRLALLKKARAMIARGSGLYETELRLRRRDGQVRWFFFRCILERDIEGRLRFSGAHTDITRRKTAEQEVLALQREALANAHAAGKAELATTVLHNVGNVLNSVNVDAAEIRRGVRDMRLDRLALALEMIAEHRDDLAAFFASEKGRKLEAYLGKVIEAAAREREVVANHTEEIHKKIEIARDIIETQ